MRKRRILAETLGLILAVLLTTANVDDGAAPQVVEASTAMRIPVAFHAHLPSGPFLDTEPNFCPW